MPHEHDQVRPTPDEVADGVPATSETPANLDPEAVEEESPPLDRPMAVDDWGTTPAEEQAGEPLDRRRRREVPDHLGGALDPEDEDDLSEIEGTLGAEHAALRIEEEPPGMSYAPDPGYLSDDDR